MKTDGKLFLWREVKTFIEHRRAKVVGYPIVQTFSLMANISFKERESGCGLENVVFKCIIRNERNLRWSRGKHNNKSSQGHS